MDESCEGESRKVDRTVVPGSLPLLTSASLTPIPISITDLIHESVSVPLSVTLNDFGPFARNALVSPQSALIGTPKRHRQRLNRTRRNHTVVNKYCEEMNELNEAANTRPRIALIHSIQQENRHIRELQRENKELRLALEEHQNIMELIMSKYRQQIAKLIAVNKNGSTLTDAEEHAKIASLVERVSEMVAVMRKAALLGEDEFGEQQRIITTLATENKGLREMLEIAIKSGSVPSPSAAVSDAHTQTDGFSAPSNDYDLDQDSPVDDLDSPNRKINSSLNSFKVHS